LTNSSEIVGRGAAALTSPAWAIGLAGSVVAATYADGSDTVPLVFEFVLGIFVVLAIDKELTI
jgi:hypothetical protein